MRVAGVLGLIFGSSYRRQRLMTFLAPWKDASDSGFQITQSFLAFGSGGPFGVGLGEGKQKLFFLPEAHTILCWPWSGKNWGWSAAGDRDLLFGLFVLKGFQIAGRARDPFGRYLAMGITMLVGMQALVNAGVVTGLLPTKGLDPAVCQLWRVVVSGQFVRRRHLIEYLARPAGRAGERWPRGGRKRGVVTA